jgi:hypothetical protein
MLAIRRPSEKRSIFIGADQARPVVFSWGQNSTKKVVRQRMAEKKEKTVEELRRIVCSSFSLSSR